MRQDQIENGLEALAKAVWIQFLPRFNDSLKLYLIRCSSCAVSLFSCIDHPFVAFGWSIFYLSQVFESFFFYLTKAFCLTFSPEPSKYNCCFSFHSRQKLLFNPDYCFVMCRFIYFESKVTRIVVKWLLYPRREGEIVGCLSVWMK